MIDPQLKGKTVQRRMVKEIMEMKKSWLNTTDSMENHPEQLSHQIFTLFGLCK